MFGVEISTIYLPAEQINERTGELRSPQTAKSRSYQRSLNILWLDTEGSLAVHCLKLGSCVQ